MSSPVTPLGELIALVQADFVDRNGVRLSYGDISRRGGEVVGRTRVQQLATKPLAEMPAAETIEALARGLGVPTSLVLEKCLESTGYGNYGVAPRFGQREADPDQAATTAELRRTLRSVRRPRSKK